MNRRIDEVGLDEDRIERNQRWGMLAVFSLGAVAIGLKILQQIDDRLDEVPLMRSRTRYDVDELAERVDRLEMQLKAAHIASGGRREEDTAEN